METVLSILGVIAFFVASIGVRVWVEMRRGKKIAAKLKKAVEESLEVSNAMGMQPFLAEEGVDPVEWKDCFIIFALLMFLDQTVRAAGEVSKSDATTIEMYMGCCGGVLREMMHEPDLMEKLQEIIEPIMGLTDNGDIEHIQHVYKTSFATALKISSDSKITNLSMNLLAKQFGTWI